MRLEDDCSFFTCKTGSAIKYYIDNRKDPPMYFSDATNRELSVGRLLCFATQDVLGLAGRYLVSS